MLGKKFFCKNHSPKWVVALMGDFLISWDRFVLSTFKHRPKKTNLRGKLVGGFNPFEKYSSNWIISPSRGENKKYLKPPPSQVLDHPSGNEKIPHLLPGDEKYRGAATSTVTPS